jgi:short-subunit dehydrogenase
MEIAGSTILVTGASSGIGAALAPLLAERGATVGIVARRRDRLESVLDRCRVHAPESKLWAVDLGDLDAAERLVHDAWHAFGSVDVLVNNAAIPKRRSVVDLTTDEVDDVMRVDFTSPVRMTMALLPRWLERDHGMVVNVASAGGRLGIIHEAAYCAAKFALSGWTESMAIDLWDTGVDVRLVHPGAIETEIWDLPDNDEPFYHGPFDPPEVVAEGIAAAIESDGFEHYVPDMKGVVEFKTSNIDAFLEGCAAMAHQQPADPPSGGKP